MIETEAFPAPGVKYDGRSVEGDEDSSQQDGTAAEAGETEVAVGFVAAAVALAFLPGKDTIVVTVVGTVGIPTFVSLDKAFLVGLVTSKALATNAVVEVTIGISVIESAGLIGVAVIDIVDVVLGVYDVLMVVAFVATAPAGATQGAAIAVAAAFVDVMRIGYAATRDAAARALTGGTALALSGRRLRIQLNNRDQLSPK